MIEKRIEHVYSCLNCFISLYHIHILKKVFLKKSGKIMKNIKKKIIKIQAASKTEAGGDEKHVVFFTAPYLFCVILPVTPSIVNELFSLGAWVT